MKNLNSIHIKGTFKTPEVVFKPGLIEFSGRSIPVDSFEFYEPIIRWLDEYKQHPEEITDVIFKIEYVNSASNRFIYNILKILNYIYELGKTVNVKWFYEEDDDSMKTLGLDLKNLLTIPIDIISVEVER
ncbi:MAG: DUF1987 domain-containing protein [Bacteroidales bacterium]|jgi:hypothetical protein|nr:DUF1987 domain-containing protein [Bacteroidales bacterium]